MGNRNWSPSGGLRHASLRGTKASINYKATGNLRAVQILLEHAKIENTVRYLGVDVEDALELSEGTEIKSDWLDPHSAIQRSHPSSQLPTLVHGNPSVLQGAAPNTQNVEKMFRSRH